MWDRYNNIIFIFKEIEINIYVGGISGKEGKIENLNFHLQKNKK